jgi:hypothetical protein
MVKKLVDEEKKVFSYAWQGDYSWLWLTVVVDHFGQRMKKIVPFLVKSETC